MLCLTLMLLTFFHSEECWALLSTHSVFNVDCRNICTVHAVQD